MSYGAQFSMLTVMPIILTSRGLTISHALWFTLLMQSGSLAGALTAGAVARRFPRKLVLTAYQERKREELNHVFLGEKLSLGLFPTVQAQLLARHLRGDLDAYPPFLWK